MNDFANRISTARQGKTYLFSLGQAGFIIKSASGQLLAIDLYLSDCVERLEGHVGFKRLLPKIMNPADIEFDVIIATHPHWDHYDVDSIPQMMANGKTKLYCSVDCDKLIEQSELNYYSNNITYVKPSDRVTYGDFTIYFVNCDHGEGAPDAVGVVAEVDGKRIYEAGDTCLRLDRVDEIKEVGDIDVMIAPINGVYGNMNSEECLELAQAIKPGLTIPCHYGMFASHGGDLKRFYDVMTDKELPNLIMRQGETLVL